jgi:tetratricopeptide (TPR) repeat protein
MPKQPTENIGHSSVTDHRILRTQAEIPAAVQGGAPADVLDLISDTNPSDSGATKANLRNLALAYAQVSGRYPELAVKGLAMLERAATELPNDAEVQAAYGLVLGVARPREEERAAQALQKAVELGSQSVEVRTHLAGLRMRKGQVTAAMELYKESIQIDPYFTSAYLDLARVYVMLKDKKAALELLDSVLKMDPGNDAVREERRKVAALREDDK